jgi:NADH dehydrogenase
LPANARNFSLTHHSTERQELHTLGAIILEKLPQLHLVVVGGGFAGLWATRELNDPRFRVTLIDRRNHHLFQPLLYQVATAGLSASDIAAPLRHILRGQRNAEVRLGEVTAVVPNERAVVLADGSRIEYDALLLSSGATHSYFGKDQWAEFAPGLKTLTDALHLRRRMLEAFEHAEAETDPATRDAWLSFVIVGAGPTGVELAGALAEIARHTLKDEFRNIDPRKTRVRIIEAGPRVLATFPEYLSAKAKLQLEHLGVEVITGQGVTQIDAKGCTVGDTFIPARTVLWAAGVAASPLGRSLGVPVDRAGRVLVQPDLSVPGYPEIFVAGDLASLQQDGKPVPGVAPAAKQMGKHVARVLRARLNGTAGTASKAGTTFHYSDFGNLATIGRMAAIAHVGRFKLWGLLAWWFWLAAHVYFLIGFRNRFVVLVNWAVAYWSYRRAARVVPEPPTAE